MPVFDYCHIDPSGRECKRTIDASSIEEARRRLRDQGIRLVSITEKAGQGAPTHGLQLGWSTTGVKAKEVAMATRQLSALLKAGVPLTEGLSVLVEQFDPGALSQVLSQVRDRVNAGSSLAQAFAEYPRIFSNIYVSMVRAGENAGSLELVLSKLAEMSEKRIKLINKVRAAMTYPVFMIVVGCSVIVFVLSYVLPGITKLFLEMNMNLPWVTRVLIGTSQFFSHYLGWIVLGVFGALVGHQLWRRTPKGRLIWDRFKLRCPTFGKIITVFSIARFSRTLGVLLASGVNIVEALELSEKVIDNQVIVHIVEKARHSVSSGRSLSESLAKDKVFPPITLHMIAAGERTGALEDELLDMADTLESEVEEQLNVLTTLLEPLMIIVLGTVVGFIVLAILLPIFDINRAIV